MFIEFTGIDYVLKKEKQEELNKIQEDLFKSEIAQEKLIEDYIQDGYSEEAIEDLGLVKNNRRSSKMLLKEEDYERVEYEYFVRPEIIQEFYVNQQEDAVLKIETGELVTVKESTKEIKEKLAVY